MLQVTFGFKWAQNSDCDFAHDLRIVQDSPPKVVVLAGPELAKEPSWRKQMAMKREGAPSRAHSMAGTWGQKCDRLSGCDYNVKNDQEGQ